MHPFVVFLQDKQRQEQLSDARYARERLHVSAALYSQVLSGGRGIGRKLIIGAFRAYPAPDDQRAMSIALRHPAAPVRRRSQPPPPGRRALLGQLADAARTYLASAAAL
jgi:hypothetical protein